MTIKIEKGIPVPSPSGHPNVQIPVHAMEPGDSVLLPAQGNQRRSILVNNARQKLERAGRGHLRIVSRAQGDGMYRFWLVKKETRE